LHATEDVILKAKTRHLFKTGLAIKLPVGYVGLIRDRSGLAYKHGLTVLGGVIDSGYRGDWGVILYNTSDEDFTIKKGDRIAQVLVQRVESCEFEEVDDFNEDHVARGEKGFGSSGMQ
jgi:dUTP pyrophosphatase